MKGDIIMYKLNYQIFQADVKSE